jgi:hypothetical protein
MIQRFLQLSAFVLFFSIIGDAPRSLAATNDPASTVGDIGSRAQYPPIIAWAFASLPNVSARSLACSASATNGGRRTVANSLFGARPR